ncbi:hypothetical protein RND81_08G153800 [Saponaria officinalis]|uniref:RRM domain-containing protein n=1 Tax=Saponaria officinalis TaxID=3572 RepID=A0AAW1J830_SAPOF
MRKSRDKRFNHKQTDGNTISVFVENIAKSTERQHLHEMFTRFGQVRGVYISNKIGPGRFVKFGFVRFGDWCTAKHAVHGTSLGGYNLLVKISRFQDGKGRPWMVRNSKRKIIKKWVPKKSGTEAKTVSPEGTEVVDKNKIVNGVIAEQNLQWWRRSCIAETNLPREIEVFGQFLTSQWQSITKVCSLGLYKFIITFDTAEEMEEILAKEDHLLSNCFCKMYPWDPYQHCESRRIWLEIIGVPPQCWCRDNFEKIAQIWGELVCLDTSTEKGENLMVGKMLIDTRHLKTIDETIYMYAESLGFKIRVKESHNFPILYGSRESTGRNRLIGNLESYQWESDNSEAHNYAAPTPSIVQDTFNAEDILEGVGERLDVNVDPFIDEPPIENCEHNCLYESAEEKLEEPEESHTRLGNVSYD